jgi:hypothetical protein
VLHLAGAPGFWLKLIEAASHAAKGEPWTLGMMDNADDNFQPVSGLSFVCHPSGEHPAGDDAFALWTGNFDECPYPVWPELIDG